MLIFHKADLYQVLFATKANHFTMLYNGWTDWLPSEFYTPLTTFICGYGVARETTFWSLRMLEQLQNLCWYLDVCGRWCSASLWLRLCRGQVRGRLSYRCCCCTPGGRICAVRHVMRPHCWLLLRGLWLRGRRRGPGLLGLGSEHLLLGLLLLLLLPREYLHNTVYEFLKLISCIYLQQSFRDCTSLTRVCAVFKINVLSWALYHLCNSRITFVLHYTAYQL